MLDHVLDVLLRVLARLLRTAQHVLGELALLDTELLVDRDLVEHELGGDGVVDPLLQLGLELVDGLLLGVEVGLHRHAGHRELLLDVLAAGHELLGTRGRAGGCR